MLQTWFVLQTLGTQLDHETTYPAQTRIYKGTLAKDELVEKEGGDDDGVWYDRKGIKREETMIILL